MQLGQAPHRNAVVDQRRRRRQRDGGHGSRHGAHATAPLDDELGRPVAAARAVALDQVEEGGHDGGRLGPVGDVLARERRLVHHRAQVAWVHRPDGERRELDGEHRAEMLECRLARAVAAPAFVRLDAGVGGDVDEARAWGVEQERQRVLHQAERCDDVHLERHAQFVERVVRQRRKWRRPQRAGIVHEQIETAELDRRIGQGAAVRRLGDVPRDGHDAGAVSGVGADAVGGGVERRAIPAVDHH